MRLQLDSDLGFKLRHGDPPKESAGTFKVKDQKITLNVENVDGQPAQQSDREHPLVLSIGPDGVLTGPGMVAFRKVK